MIIYGMMNYSRGEFEKYFFKTEKGAIKFYKDDISDDEQEILPVFIDQDEEETNNKQDKVWVVTRSDNKYYESKFFSSKELAEKFMKLDKSGILLTINEINVE